MIIFLIVTFIIGKAYKQLNTRYVEFMSKLGEGDKVEKILSEYLKIVDENSKKIKQQDEYIKRLALEVGELIRASNGKSLVLFTSKVTMNKVYEILQSENFSFNILQLVILLSFSESLLILHIALLNHS